jgi:hypothetical protein
MPELKRLHAGHAVLAENVIRPGRRHVSGLAVVGLVARVGALAQSVVHAS